jgi:pimeloyl-ACP methyl ester carboxylesterase
MKKVVQSNGVDLCLETFGDPGDPPIVLIGGMGSSMDYWEDGFCDRLAAGLRFVVRYDLRDTGQSVSYPPGAPAYTGPDLIADVPALLDTLGLRTGHLVGVSMGGSLAMDVALDYPDRVASLTLISTSAGPGDPDLPPMSEDLRAAFAQPPPEPDWSDRTAVIDFLVADERPYFGSLPYDEAARRELIGRIVDRTTNPQSAATNHGFVEGGEPLRPRLGRITAPTLVLHGTEDPFFPYHHGEALANEIPGARLIPVEKMGHEFPPAATWDVVVPAILEHTA